MSDTAKVIFGAFMAFFCLFLGGWLLLRGTHEILGFLGAFFAASGATFFFVFFFRK